ncbi:MAG: protein kinase [Phormidesmis sp.]
MQLHCTRPHCPSPVNHFSDLDGAKLPYPLKQRYCSACRMELVLRGRYLPQSVLGQGGFGTAFLAIDIDSPTRSKCVVKLFQPPVTLNDSQMETALTLFAREAQVLERLGRRHPQIPNLYAYFPLPVTSPLTNKSEELFYLVQEFIDGEDLEKVRDRQGKLSEVAVMEILREILGVLDFVHAEGAIHRDVKPSNIMQGSDGRLSLLDFGAVKEVTTPNSAQRGPTTICSPEYAPPEQIMNGQVNATSDLYALAATCVVLLTNKESNELRDSASNSWKWRSYASVSTDLANILNRMLRARPSDRFPAAKDVLSALDAVSRGSSTPPAAVPLATPSANPRSAQRPASSASNPASSSASASNSPIGSPLPTPGQVASGQIAPNTPNAPISASAPPMSMIQFLSSAAFMGAEGGLLAIAAFSLLGTSLFGGAAWLLMVGVLFFLQLRRTIEGKDLVIIAGLTLAAVLFFGALNSGISGGTPLIILTMVMAAGGVVAIAIIFRLIFRLVSRIM